MNRGYSNRRVEKPIVLFIATKMQLTLVGRAGWVQWKLGGMQLSTFKPGVL